jgi:hypothetical protein
MVLAASADRRKWAQVRPLGLNVSGASYRSVMFRCRLRSLGGSMSSRLHLVSGSKHSRRDIDRLLLPRPDAIAAETTLPSVATGTLLDNACVIERLPREATSA